MSIPGRVFSTLREAIHATATGSRMPMKALAAELDMSPSELSMRTTLGGDSARAFPADDRLILLQRVSGDYSVLATMADLLGYELQPKPERRAQLVAELHQEFQKLGARVQLLLDLRDADGKGRAKR